MMKWEAVKLESPKAQMAALHSQCVRPASYGSAESDSNSHKRYVFQIKAQSTFPCIELLPFSGSISQIVLEV